MINQSTFELLKAMKAIYKTIKQYKNMKKCNYNAMKYIQVFLIKASISL